MKEKSPAELHHRDKPMVVQTADGAKLEVWAESGGVASVAGGVQARISNPEWLIRAKGVEYALDMEATIYDSEDWVRDRALAWWEKKRETWPRSGRPPQ